MADPDAQLTHGEGKLSPKEQRILELLAQGLTEQEIGQQMQLSLHSVRLFLENARVKLGPSSS